MNKVLSFVKLDLITIKPYLTWKQLLIFSFAPIALIINSAMTTATFTVFMIFGMFGMIFSGYPFAIGEKSTIDSLYIVLSIKRNTVVFGRYIFVLIFNLFAVLFAYGLTFTAFVIQKQAFDFKQTLITMLIFFTVYTIIQAVQLPIMFKFGYAKAKFLVFLPFACIPAIIYLFGGKLSEKISELFSWFAKNQSLGVMLAAAVWLALMTISYRISLSFYNKRDF